MKRLTISILCYHLLACVSLPDVYVIDRHTVMEAEASGEWPQLEQRFQEQSLSKGSINLTADLSSERKARAFRVLNSEFPTPESPTLVESATSESPSQTKSPNP